MEGKKYDSGKLRYDLIPPELDAAVATVLTYGAVKYHDRNWEAGMLWSRPYAAMRRHMDMWWAGEVCDQETGMPHLWHAACCIAFLIGYEERATGEDDRPKDRVAPEPMRMEHFTDMLAEAMDRLKEPGEHPIFKSDRIRGGVQAPTIEQEVEDEDILREAAKPFAPPGLRGPVYTRPKPNFGPAAEDGEGEVDE